jgi:hypothetical protein
MQVWMKWFQYYFRLSFLLASAYFDVSATFDCLLFIRKYNGWFKSNKTFIATIGVIFISSFAFYTSICTAFEIVEKSSDIFIFQRSAYYYSKPIFIHIILHGLLRDVIPFILLVILNSMILLSIKKTAIKRRHLNTSTIKIERAEKKKVKLIIFINLIYILRVPIVIFNFDLFNVKSHPCLADMCWLFLYISYMLPIFAYIFYNKKFKKYFLKIIFFCVEYLFKRNNKIFIGDSSISIGDTKV